MRDEPAYILDTSERERRRLMRQAERLKPHTVRMLGGAGLKPGDKVLDVGSGAGDVAFLAASMVGPEGKVVGIDRDPAQVEFARGRARELAIDNVAFMTADASAFEGEALFDAVIGRLILIHTPNLDETLDGLASLLKPGGTLAFHEFHWWRGWRPRIDPDSLMDEDIRRAMRLTSELTERAGGNLDIGVKLPALLARYGEATAMVVTPVMVGRAQVEDAMDYALDSVRSFLPAAERLGLIKSGELDLEGAMSRFRTRLAELAPAEPAMEMPAELLAFVRKRG